MKREQLLSAIGEIDEELIASAANHPGRRVRRARPLAALAAAVLLCAALTVPALAAANVEPAYRLLYAAFPAIAQELKPVNLSCEDNGIELEVVSAHVHGDSAEIYVSLRDLTGDRIDGTTDLFDSYSINTPFDSRNGCTLVGCDEATKTATFLIRVTQFGQADITGAKITFSVGGFLSHKAEFCDSLDEISLSAARQDPETQTEVRLRGGSGTAEAGIAGTEFLSPQADFAFSPTPGVTVTALGWIDGALHLQAHYDNIHETDNHGYLYLTAEDGTVLKSGWTASFWDESGAGSYEEYVFQISPEEAANCRVYGHFWTCDTLVTGSWQVTFPIGDSGE